LCSNICIDNFCIFLPSSPVKDDDGFIPIIAHPERNKAIAQNINLLYELINHGALSQLLKMMM
jgi:hypothetical protein